MRLTASTVKMPNLVAEAFCLMGQAFCLMRDARHLTDESICPVDEENFLASAVCMPLT
jgi:hypothetical protein